MRVSECGSGFVRRQMNRFANFVKEECSPKALLRAATFAKVAQRRAAHRAAYHHCSSVVALVPVSRDDLV